MTAREHVYLSTACFHGQHGRCSDTTALDANGNEFARRPAQCKFCGARCVCWCHRQPSSAKPTSS